MAHTAAIPGAIINHTAALIAQSALTVSLKVQSAHMASLILQSAHTASLVLQSAITASLTVRSAIMASLIQLRASLMFHKCIMLRPLIMLL